MPIDLSHETREETDEPIPPGIYRLQAEITPGGYGDGDLLKRSNKGTLAYLKIANHVFEGPHKNRVIYDMIMVEPIGNKPTDGEQQITRKGRGRVRRIVESARCVDVDNEPVATLSDKLSITSWGDIHGLAYYAQVGIQEADGTYRAKNTVERIITPADKEWPGTPTTPATPMRAIVIARGSSDDMNDEIPF
jgi:hypothetical protein